MRFSEAARRLDRYAGAMQARDPSFQLRPVSSSDRMRIFVLMPYNLIIELDGKALVLTTDKTQPGLDPITVEIYHALGIGDQAALTLHRTSFSTVVRETSFNLSSLNLFMWNLADSVKAFLKLQT